MKSLRQIFAGASALALAACSNAPAMDEDAARSALAEFRQHGERICEREGLRDFRRAARAYAQAQRAQGELWPSAAALGGASDAQPQDIEILAIGAMVFGLIPASDLGGDAPRIKRYMEASLPPGFSLQDINVRGSESCAEVFASFEDITRYSLQSVRMSRQMRRAARDGDGERMRELYERHQRLMRRYQMRLETMREALERARV